MAGGTGAVREGAVSHSLQLCRACTILGLPRVTAIQALSAADAAHLPGMLHFGSSRILTREAAAPEAAAAAMSTG